MNKQRLKKIENMGDEALRTTKALQRMINANRTMMTATRFIGVGNTNKGVDYLWATITYLNQAISSLEEGGE